MYVLNMVIAYMESIVDGCIGCSDIVFALPRGFIYTCAGCYV